MGPGVRTDGFGYTGYRTSNAFDSLLAKVIAHSPSPDFADAVARTTRALSEFRLEGVSTNIAFLATCWRIPTSSAAPFTPAGSTSISKRSQPRSSGGSASCKAPRHHPRADPATLALR